MSRSRRQARAAGATRAAGQSLVEFAVVLPVFLSLLLGVFDLGRVVWAHNTVESAAREAARYAIVHGGTVLTDCPTGPDYLGRTCAGLPLGDRSAVAGIAREWAGGGAVVGVCYGDGCAGSLDTPGATNQRGTPVTVRVATTVDLLLTRLFALAFPGLNLGRITVDASVTMLVNT